MLKSLKSLCDIVIHKPPEWIHNEKIPRYRFKYNLFGETWEVLMKEIEI